MTSDVQLRRSNPLRSTLIDPAMTWPSMVSELVYFHRVDGLLQYTVDYWFLPSMVLVFCRLITIIITIPPVSLTKGGVTNITELVSLYGQLIFGIKPGFQAQFQAIKVELRQFCTIIFT